jgi:hypothetical protein
MKNIKKIKFKKYFKFLVLFVGLLFFYQGVVFAINIVSEGFKINNTDTTQIDAHGVCKKVTNSTGQGIFVPTKTSNEWGDFRNNKPSNVVLAECCVWTPTCSTGSYNPSINKCESTYAATFSGGVVFDKPVYANDYYGDGIPILTRYSSGSIIGTYYVSSSLYDDGFHLDGPWSCPAHQNICGGSGGTADLNGYYASKNSFSNSMPLFLGDDGGSVWQASDVYSQYNCVNGLTTSGGTGTLGYVCGFVSKIPQTVGGSYTCPNGGTLSGSNCIVQTNPVMQCI